MMQEYVNPHYNILIIVSSILKVIRLSIINRTWEDQIKIIDKDAKNKFTWSWLEKFVTVELYRQLKYVHVYIVCKNTYRMFLFGAVWNFIHV